MRHDAAGDARASIRRHIVVGCAVVAFLAVGLGGWAATAEIAGALIAQGSLVVDSNVKKVQHPSGGVVGEVRAHDGDRVKAGDILVRLDETVTRANLAIITKGLTELYARKARNAMARIASRRQSNSRTRSATRTCRRLWPASASCSNCGAPRGSARRINCNSGSSSCKSKSRA
jgi:multidrug efflux pump subunit AcrA (membrane-fusion protein)